MPRSRQLKLGPPLDMLVQRAVMLLETNAPADGSPYYGCFSGGKDSVVIKELAGDVERVQMRLDADEYDLTLTDSVGEVMVVRQVKATKATLTAKPDKQTEDVALRLQLLFEFRWTDETLLYIAHHMQCKLELVAVERQTRMDFDDGKRGRKAKPEALSDVKARQARAEGREDWTPPMWRCERCTALLFERDLSEHCGYHDEEASVDVIQRLFKAVEVTAPAAKPAAAA